MPFSVEGDPMMSKRSLAAGISALVLATGVAVAAQSGILNPDWSKPAAGTYEKPHGELGKKTTAQNVWTTTTTGAAITGQKPLPGKPVSITGEIIDYSCYMQVGKHGEKHRECGQKCIRNGQPVGIVAKDGTIYLLMDEEHDPRRDGDTAFRNAAVEHMAHVMTVNGTLTEVNGQRAIYVQGYLKQ
jgi:hypothetical protein